MDNNAKIKNKNILPEIPSSIDTCINDPARLILLKNITPELMDSILKWGPCQPQSEDLPNGKFPEDNIKRHFLPKWYKKTFHDGKLGVRDWLSYSPHLDKVFCLYCILFANNSSKTWTQFGFSRWKDAVHCIIIHETSSKHIDATLKFKIRESSLPLLPSVIEKRKSQISINRELVKQLIDIILYLGRHSLALRGHREKFSDSLRGNYKDLLLLFSSHSPIIASYLTKLQTQGRSTLSFISWERQNQMIDAISSYIAKKIVDAISKSGIFSISMDTSFDVSRSEQLSFVVRYVDETTGCVRERFLAMKSTPSTSGQSLMVAFEEICKKNNLLWKENLIGQSYDGASNMRGQYNGLQAYIRDINPHASYVWCWAHRLNLVITDSVSCCLNALDIFGTLETLYDYVSSSKNRVWLFEKFQKQRYPKSQIKRLKRVDTTRWNSQSSALTTVLETFLAILDLLDAVRNGEGASDRRAGSDAGNLKSYMTTERFVYSAVIFKKLFLLLHPLSKMLQSPDLDLFAAADMVNQTKKHIFSIRNEESFQQLVIEAKTFMSSLKEDIEFASLPIIRSRKKKMAGELTYDEVESDSLKHFKINTYYTVIDHINGQIDSRFNNQNQDLLKDLSLLTHRRILEVKQKSGNLPNDAFYFYALIYKKFIDKDALINEYCHFVNYYEELLKSKQLPNQMHLKKGTNFHPNDSDLSNDSDSDSDIDDDFSYEVQEPHNSRSMVSLFSLFCTAKLQTVFPNLYMAIKIAVTLPVSSTTTERSFSKLKLIKTRLRSTMGANRLEGLMRMSCEFDIDIDYEEVINTFSSFSPKLQNALSY